MSPVQSSKDAEAAGWKEYRQMKEKVEGKDVILGESPRIKEVLTIIISLHQPFRRPDYR
jgi:hypothetical protein